MISILLLFVWSKKKVEQNISKQSQSITMNTTPNGPLEDIKQLGKILMRHSSEKGNQNVA